ncbi:breast carcinoma-amplified sequence 1 isoform X1 [Castor canadensis]|uniref:Breast carcinoma-amplified sequence 1 isoform X1 n=1 Tax=Castor canadensis TaxID=51338 RepID=A0AC58MNY6_CASCN
MGNQMSVPQRVEDQELESEADTYKVTEDSECGQNGIPVVVSTCTVQHYDEVDLGIRVPKDNAATSSSKTMETSAALDARGKNLGKEAKPEAPAAKSRFFLTLSRPVPGRPGDQGLDSSATPARLDGSSSTASTDKDPSERKAHPAAAVPRPAGDKTPGQTPAGDQAQAATCQPAPLPPESGAAAPSKPKDSSFFDKFFKLDKGQEKAPVESQEQVRSAEHQDQAEEAPGPTGPTDGVSTREDVVDGKETEGQQTEIWNCSGPGDPEGRGIAKEDSQTTDIAENSSIMSFFKTLVSPNKAETKKDPEDVASKAEGVCDGQAGQKMTEIQAKGSKKKHLDSPRLGLTFRKFFRHKGTETTSTTSANLRSDKGNFTPQETQVTPKSPKGCSPPGHALSATASDTTKEGGKEKSGTSSLPLGKLFRKKSVKEDSVPTGAEENVVCESPVEILKFEKVESASQTVDLNEEKGVPEPAEVKLRGGESKPRRTSLMSFFRQMSVKGDGGITHPEEINAKDSSYQTSNSTEKATTPPEPEPAAAAQKAKEGSTKDKKSVPEMNKHKSSKQEAKEPAQCVEPAALDSNSLQNGDKSQKRPEKRRQSLGGFLKGLGPKRMLDAQVQTDPVSIGPAGKSK